MIRSKRTIANVELRYGDEVIKLRALVDTGTSRSVISKKLAEKLGAFIPLKKTLRA